MSAPVQVERADSAADAGPNIAQVIEILPDRVYENPTALGIAYFARDLLLYGAVVTGLIFANHALLLIPLWVLASLTISALFIVGHDCAHGALFQSKRLGYVIGQIAMLPALHVYEAWVYGHNRIHHGHTVREVMDYVWHPTSPADYRAMTRMQRALHRLKWSWLGAGVYYGWDIWWRNMIRFTPPEKIAADVRRDRRIVLAYAALASAALFALGAGFYGGVGGALWMWVKVFGIPFALWNYSIGIAVYVHHISPEIAWHERREWTRFKGQMEGTTILHIPVWLNFFYHNIFLHVPHHVDMRIPFYHLSEAADAIRANFGDVVREHAFGLRDYLRTTRACKLYDFATQSWHGYEAARAEPLVSA
ncbi:MAG TPA: fatty acid desaturase [Myxococcota bacterium]|nr:fatty acid desaturase [Myxococcota bacterium]